MSVDFATFTTLQLDMAFSKIDLFFFLALILSCDTGDTEQKAGHCSLILAHSATSFKQLYSREEIHHFRMAILGNSAAYENHQQNAFSVLVILKKYS